MLRWDCSYLHMQRIPLVWAHRWQDRAINLPQILPPCNRRPSQNMLPQRLCRCESRCKKKRKKKSKSKKKALSSRTFLDPLCLSWWSLYSTEILHLLFWKEKACNAIIFSWSKTDSYDLLVFSFQWVIF